MAKQTLQMDNNENYKYIKIENQEKIEYGFSLFFLSAHVMVFISLDGNSEIGAHATSNLFV